MTGLIIHESGSVGLKDFHEPLYLDVKETLGGYMEIVLPKHLPDPFILLVNETGLLQDLKLNILASWFYGSFDRFPSPPCIVGPVIIMKEVFTEEGPDIGGLDRGDVFEICALIDIYRDLFEEVL